jgi:hypothetical protein
MDKHFLIKNKYSDLDCLTILRGLIYYSILEKKKIFLDSKYDKIISLVKEFGLNRFFMFSKFKKDFENLSLNKSYNRAKNNDFSFLLYDLIRSRVENGNYKKQYLSFDYSKVYHFKLHDRLGDALSIVCGFENYCKDNGVKTIMISGPKIFRDVIDLFNIEHVKYINERGSKNIDYLYTLASWNLPWMKRFNDVLVNLYGGNGCRDDVVLRLKDNKKVNKKDIVYCQFDTGSSNRELIKNSRKILDIFSKEKNVVVLGGPTTPDYMGNDFIYERGDLSFLIDKLLACKLFIGCDSGIGHLAGILGVKSVIISFTDYEPVYHFFKKYKKTITVPFNIINLFK